MKAKRKNFRNKGRLNFKLSQVKVEKVVEELGIEYQRKDENELYASCPSIDHSDRNPSWHIHSELGSEQNGLFHCWGCGWSGNLISLVQYVLGCDQQEVYDLLGHCSLDVDVSRVKMHDGDWEVGLYSFEPPFIEDVVYRGKVQNIVQIKSGSRAERYLSSRMFDLKYSEKYSIKDWKLQGRILIPIYRKGGMISWIARSYLNRDTKVLAPKNAPKKWELFGHQFLDYGKEEVNICEGWADVLRLDQIDMINPVALCGSTMSEYQADELSAFGKIVIWKDGDKAGDKMVRSIASWLGRNRVIEVVVLPDGEDPASISPWTLESEFGSISLNDFYNQ